MAHFLSVRTCFPPPTGVDANVGGHVGVGVAQCIKAVLAKSVQDLAEHGAATAAPPALSTFRIPERSTHAPLWDRVLRAPTLYSVLLSLLTDETSWRRAHDIWDTLGDGDATYLRSICTPLTIAWTQAAPHRIPHSTLYVNVAGHLPAGDVVGWSAPIVASEKPVSGAVVLRSALGDMAGVELEGGLWALPPFTLFQRGGDGGGDLWWVGCVAAMSGEKGANVLRAVAASVAEADQTALKALHDREVSPQREGRRFEGFQAQLMQTFEDTTERIHNPHYRHRAVAAAVPHPTRRRAVKPIVVTKHDAQQALLATFSGVRELEARGRDGVHAKYIQWCECIAVPRLVVMKTSVRLTRTVRREARARTFLEDGEVVAWVEIERRHVLCRLEMQARDTLHALLRPGCLTAIEATRERGQRIKRRNRKLTQLRELHTDETARAILSAAEESGQLEATRREWEEDNFTGVITKLNTEQNARARGEWDAWFGNLERRQGDRAERLLLSQASRVFLSAGNGAA